MFTDYTLIPGGAMVVCESISEFDPNMTSEQVPDDNGLSRDHVVSGLTPPAEHPIRAALARDTAYCPLAALSNKLRPLYDEVRGLMTAQLTFDAPEEMAAHLEHVSSLASQVFDMMRLCLVKTGALYRYLDGSGYYMEPVREFGGFFIRKGDQLMKDGFDSITSESSWLPEIEVYNIRRRVNTCMEYDDLLPMAPTDIFSVVDWCSDKPRFNNSDDFLNCFFNDPERLQRLQKTEQRSHNLKHLVRSPDCDCTCEADGCKTFDASLITWMSRVLRAIKMRCYSLQCDLIDPGQHVDITNRSHMSPLYSAVVNMFTYPAVLLIAEAYEIENAMAARDAIQAGVNEILTHYGVKPGR